MKLRLYHHGDGARIAYREAGTGPPLALLHSAGLTHRELEPLVEGLDHRYRVVLPDLPLHGDSEDRPWHPYTPAWAEDVLCGFLADTCGPRPLVGGHGLGAMLLVRAIAAGRLDPSRLVLLPCPLHRGGRPAGRERAVRGALRACAVPGGARAVSHVLPRMVERRAAGELGAAGAPGVADLLRHALSDLGGNAARARGWRRAARAWPTEAQIDLLDAYAHVRAPTLLLWADRDPAHPLAIAEEALDLLPDAQLRVLPGTGYLIAYDDPVGVAREIAAFCG